MSKFFEILDGEERVCSLDVPKTSGEYIVGVKEGGKLTVRFDEPFTIGGLTERDANHPFRIKRRFDIVGEDSSVVDLGLTRNSLFETSRQTFPAGTYELRATIGPESACNIASGWRIAKVKETLKEIRKIGLVLCNYRLERTMPFENSCKTLQCYVEKNLPNAEILLFDEPSSDAVFDYAAEANSKIEKAIEAKCDVVVLCDADSFLTEEFWNKALKCDEQRVVAANAVDVSLMYYVMRGLDSSASDAANKIVAVAARREAWEKMRFVPNDKKVPFFEKLQASASSWATFEIGDVVAHAYHGRRNAWKYASNAEKESYLSLKNEEISKTNCKEIEPGKVVENNPEPEAVKETTETLPKKRVNRKSKNKDVGKENKDELD